MFDVNSLINIQPESAENWNMKGNINLMFDDNVEAINNYSIAIRLKSDYSEAYYNRAIAYFMSNRIPEGCEDLKTSLNLGYKPTNSFIMNFCKN
jgi:lipoprotein NlpI